MLNCVLVLLGFVVWNLDGAVLVKRYRRQLIPLEHVQVHSLRSNVTVLEDTIDARSLDSILEFNKAPYNISYFSRQSLASFDSKASFIRVNGSFSDMAISLYGVHLRCMADRSSLDLRMNPNNAEETELRAGFAESVNFGVSDERFNLAIFNGTAASLRARTGAQRRQRMLRFGYENSTDEFRVNFMDQTAVVDVTVQGELIHLTYGPIIVQIDRHFRRLILLSPSHRIEFHTIGATFQASISDNSLYFDFLTDRIRVTISNNSPNISVNILTSSKSDVDRTHGVDINLNNEMSNNLDHLQLIAKVLQLQLLTGQNEPSILANANSSVLTLTTNKTEVKLAASNQLVKISGHTPLLVTTTENVAMVITGRGNGTITPPHILEPQVDYAGYDLQNLTNFPTQQEDSHWLTSKLNLKDLINQEISNIEDFPPVLGESFRGDGNSGGVVSGDGSSNGFPFNDNRGWPDWSFPSNTPNSIASNTDLLFPTEPTKDTFSLQPFGGMENINPDNDDSLFGENGQRLPSAPFWSTTSGPVWSGGNTGGRITWVTVSTDSTAPARPGQPEFVNGEEPGRDLLTTTTPITVLTSQTVSPTTSQPESANPTASPSQEPSQNGTNPGGNPIPEQSEEAETYLTTSASPVEPLPSSSASPEEQATSSPVEIETTVLTDEPQTVEPTTSSPVEPKAPETSSPEGSTEQPQPQETATQSAGQENADNDLFPTPPSLERTITETGFPIPPMPGHGLASTEGAEGNEETIPEVETNSDTGDVSNVNLQDQTYDRNEDSFAIAHFGEVSTPLPTILATIVNITILSPTTPSG